MRSISLFFCLSLLAQSARGLAPKGPWDAFNFAPTSKTVYPAAIREVEGTVTNSERLVNNGGSATLSGQGTWVTLDFGVEVNKVTDFDGSSHLISSRGRRTHIPQLRFHFGELINRALLH
jgi:hypothetical protein